MLLLTTIGLSLAIYQYFPKILWLLIDLGFAEADVRAFDWRAFAPIIFAALSSPIWFLLWFFRDKNNREKLANEVHEITQTAFQELQMKACGIFEADIGHEDARETLQRASISQLGDYLSGRFGARYQLPAFETLSEIGERLDHQSGAKQIFEKFDRIREFYRKRQNRIGPTAIIVLRRHIQNSQKKLTEIITSKRYFLASSRRISINSKYALKLGFFSQRRNIFNVNIVNIKINSGEIEFCGFLSSTFYKIKFIFSDVYIRCNICNFQNVKFSFSRLSGDFFGCAFTESSFFRADISGLFICCRFMKGVKNTDFRYANANGCDFRGSQFNGADFRFASLLNAKFDFAILDDVDFRGADLRGIDPRQIASMRNVRFDESTLFCRKVGHFESEFEVEVGVEQAKADWIRLTGRGE